MDEFIFVAIGVGVGLLIFWAVHLLDLMRRRDDEFPGRHDKALWVFILVLCPVIGVIVYSIWKPRAAVAAKGPPALEREWAVIQAKRVAERLQREAS
jgi:hypothetical protein